MLNNLLQTATKKITQLATKNKSVRNFIEKRQISMEFPASLFIEPTNLCNLKCNMCPQSMEGIAANTGEGSVPKVERGFMDFDLYKGIIDESLKFGRRITIFFHKDGEPLLHPRLPEMIEYAVSRKAAYQTHLSTNAMLLGEKIMDGILMSGIDSIVVNIDAATEETYRKIKKVPGLEKVEGNVRHFIEMRKKLGRVKPFIRVKLIPVKENIEEIELFRKKWNKLADEVVISREFSWPGFLNKKGAGSEAAIYTEDRYPCITLWLALTINWDGTVSLCCIDFFHRGILGNLKESSIKDLWRGERLREIRTAHLGGGFSTVPVCSDCKGLWLRDTLGRGSEKWLRREMEKAGVL